MGSTAETSSAISAAVATRSHAVTERRQRRRRIALLLGERCEEHTHVGARGAESTLEGGLVFVSERAGESIARRPALGDRVGLIRALDVDAMLDATKERPGRLEGALLALRQQAEGEEPSRSFDGSRYLKLGVTTAPDQLQALDEELRLADAAVAELHVALRVDLQLSARLREHVSHRRGDPWIDRRAER